MIKHFSILSKIYRETSACFLGHPIHVNIVLSHGDRTMIHLIEYFAKSLKVTQDHFLKDLA